MIHLHNNLPKNQKGNRIKTRLPHLANFQLLLQTTNPS